MEQEKKTNSTFKKVLFAIIGLSIMVGVYSGIIVLCNRYLRENDLINPISKTALILLLILGLYQIYKWFCRRIDKISKS